MEVQGKRIRLSEALLPHKHSDILVYDDRGSTIFGSVDPGESSFILKHQPCIPISNFRYFTICPLVEIQRCQVHKKRNVLSHLPQSEQTNIGFALSRAYLEFDEKAAKQALEKIMNTLEPRYPKAAFIPFGVIRRYWMISGALLRDAISTDYGTTSISSPIHSFQHINSIIS